jgi:polyhydroxyalkanoate synthesis regulator phasin
VALQLLPTGAMAQDFETMLRELFGDSLNKLSGFQNDQMKKVMSKVQDIARESLKDDLAALHTELNELRERVKVLEEERARAASDSLEASF